MERIQISKYIIYSFLLLAHFTSNSVQAKPGLTWSEESLNAVAIKGTVVVKNVSFVPSKAIENLSFKIAGSPQLISLIEVVELAPGPAAPGTEVHLALVFNIPADTPERKFRGTLHARDGNATIARPLNIRLAVNSGSAEIIPEIISIPSADRLYIDTLIDGEYVLGEAIVGFEPNTSQEDIKSTIGLLGGVFLGSIPELRLYQVGFPYANDPGLLAKVIEQLGSQPNVGLASHSWIGQSRKIPDEGDSAFPPRSWSESGWLSTAPYKYIGLPDAWDLTVGDSATKIAILDYGFDWYNDDLKNNVIARGGTTESDHGTLVAAIVPAEGDNGIGMAGVMWDATLILMAEKIPFIDKEKDLFLSVITASHKAIDEGAKIINYSGGKCSNNVVTVGSQNLVWKWFLLNSEKAKDVLFVFATGNTTECGDDSTYKIDRFSSPSGLAKDYENVISVTSIGFDYDLVEPTNELDGFGGTVTIAAPGNWVTPLGNGNATSFATPVVTGVAGLMLSINNQLTPSQLKQIIIESSKKPERKVINEDIYVIDAASAVECADRFKTGAIDCTLPEPIALFFDDFEDGVIDPSLWEYRGNTVSEVGGELHVDVTVTDSIGIASTRNIIIDPTKPLYISRRHKVYAANDYFDAGLRVTVDGYPEHGFGVSYANYIYNSGDSCPAYGISIYRNGANPHTCSGQLNDVSTSIAPIWETWFEENIVFDPQTGDLTYSIDGQVAIEYNIGALPSGADTLKFTFAPWGWFTGHYSYTDDFLVSQ